jgi:hypothetical protein
MWQNAVGSVLLCFGFFRGAQGRRWRMDRQANCQVVGAELFEGANLMQTNERVATRRQALGLALKALAVVVPVAAVIASGSKEAQAAPAEYRNRYRRRRWWW